MAVGLLVLGTLGGVVAIWAAERVQVLGFVPGKNGVPDGWELFVNVGEADLALVQDGEDRALELRSRASSFSLQRTVAIDLTRTPLWCGSGKSPSSPSEEISATAPRTTRRLNCTSSFRGKSSGKRRLPISGTARLRRGPRHRSPLRHSTPF